jgi:hypothetical protein
MPPKSDDPRSLNEKELIVESEKLEAQLARGEMCTRETSRLKHVRRCLAQLQEMKRTRV